AVLAHQRLRKLAAESIIEKLSVLRVQPAKSGEPAEPAGSASRRVAIDQERATTRARGADGGRDSRGAAAHDDDVELFTHGLSSRSRKCPANSAASDSVSVPSACTREKCN